MNWKIQLFLIASLFVSTSLFSQSLDRASISGRVTDESGAVVIEAAILLVNEETNHRQSTLSGKTGDFDFPFVTSGSYVLSVQAKDFPLLKIEGLRLASNQKLNLPITLKVGPLETNITVTSTPNHIDTSSATVQHVISENELKDMPILSDGHVRGVLYLLPLLVPGANTVDNEPFQHDTSGQRVSINGSPIAAVGYTFNGIDNYNFGGYGYPGGSGTVGPNPDALGEFSVLTHTFKAENGDYPVIVNLQTKSGTNSLHGQVRGIYQDPKLDARDFFAVDNNNGRIIRTWGAQLSGPVVIPKLYNGKNKTLFFVDLERSWIRNSFPSVQPTIPLPERSGDFSKLPQSLWPKDPLTGQVFPGGRIPTNRILPQSQHYIDQFLAMPNRESELVGNGMGDDNGTALNLRIDQQFSTKDTLSGSLFYSHQNGDYVFGPVIGTSYHITNPGNNIALHYAHQFSPRSVNSLTFGLSHSKFSNHIDGQSSQVDLIQYGFNIHQDMSGSTGFPRIILPSTNYFNPGGEKEGGNYSVSTVKDDFAFSHGIHALKFGADFRWWRSDNVYSRDSMPTFIFLDQNPFGSGNEVADLLLGIPLNYSQGSDTSDRPRRNLFAAYIQDDFKLRSNLTLNVGLRYELNGVWTSADGKNAFFRPGAQSRVFPEAPAGMLFPGDTDPSSGAKLGFGAYPTDYNNFAPRIGLSYLPSSDNTFLNKLFGSMGSTAIRAGYGIYYSPSRGGGANFDFWFGSIPPWSFSVKRDPSQLHESGGTFANPWGSTPDPFSAPLSQRGFNLPIRGLTERDPNLSEPYQQQWTLSIQRQLPQDFILELAYLGNATVHLPRTYELNPGLMTAKANPFNVDSRRAYQDFGSITGYASDGMSSYNAFQVRLNRRFTSHFLLNAHYVWSKAIDDAGGAPPNAFTFPNRDVTPRARANTDSRNQFVLYGVWELPQVKYNKVLDKVTSGWQVGGIVQMGSGVPYNIRNDIDSTLQGIATGSPDLIAPFRNLDPRQVQTFTLPNGRTVTGHFLFDPTVFRSVFPTNPDEARLGNLGRNVFTGPGVNNVDISMLKQIVLHDTHRIDLRIDVVNAFNHAQFAFWYYTQNISGFQFGSTSWTTGPREIQLYLRYSF